MDDAFPKTDTISKLAIKNNSNELLADKGSLILKSVKQNKNEEESNAQIKKINSLTDESHGIKITNITAKWSEDLNEDTLTDISVDVKTGSLVAVIGPVASGKV